MSTHLKRAARTTASEQIIDGMPAAGRFIALAPTPSWSMKAVFPGFQWKISRRRRWMLIHSN